jgi:hypothetical protein
MAKENKGKSSLEGKSDGPCGEETRGQHEQAVGKGAKKTGGTARGTTPRYDADTPLPSTGTAAGKKRQTLGE